MSINFNQWIGEGNISRDPELRFTHNNNKPVTNFHLFIDSKYKSKDEEESYKKRTSKIPVVAWANKADYLSKNFKKGDKVRIVGSLRSRTIEKDGAFFNSLEVVMDEISLIRRPNNSD